MVRSVHGTSYGAVNVICIHTLHHVNVSIRKVAHFNLGRFSGQCVLRVLTHLASCIGILVNGPSRFRRCISHGQRKGACSVRRVLPSGCRSCGSNFTSLRSFRSAHGLVKGLVLLAHSGGEDCRTVGCSRGIRGCTKSGVLTRTLDDATCSGGPDFLLAIITGCNFPSEARHILRSFVGTI